MRQEQWKQTQEWMKMSYDNRRMLSMGQSQDDLSATISNQDGIYIGDLYHYLLIGDGIFILDGKPITTLEEKTIAKNLMSRFMERVRYGPDKLSIIQLTSKHNMLKHLTIHQLSSLRSAHRQFSSIGEKQLRDHRTLEQKKFPLDKTLTIHQERQIVSSELDSSIAMSLIGSFSSPHQLPSRVYRKIMMIFSMPKYENKHFVWGYDHGSTEADLYYEKFVIVARYNRLVRGVEKRPAFLCMCSNKSKSRAPYAVQNTTSNLLIFDVGKERPIMQMRTLFLPSFEWNKILKKVIHMEEIELEFEGSVIHMLPN